tara:strand:+ start:329 stop:631 length:303 start_codon:yes stop_codon:yes gene_type:complete
MDDNELFVMGFTGEEVKALISMTTKGFTFNLDLLDHVIGSDAYADEVGVWSRAETMSSALIVYKAYQMTYGVSAIVKHAGNQLWVWKAPQRTIDHEMLTA